MRTSRPLRRRLGAATVLAVAVVVAACTDESTTAPAGSPTPATPAASPPPAATATAAATPVPTPSPSPSPEATAGVAAPDLAIDGDTRWGDLFETLTAAEQSCFREQLGAALDEALAQPIDGAAAEEWEVTAFACLAPATAQAVFTEVLLADMADDGIEPDAAELACLRETVAATDIAALVAATAREGDPGVAGFASAFLGCLPDVLLELLLLGTGLDAGSLRADERACLLEAFDAADWVAAAAGDDDAGVTFALKLYGCVPALYLYELMGEEVALSEADAACLREVVADLDTVALIEGDADASEAAFGEIVSCVPGLILERTLGEVIGEGLAAELGEAEAACLREAFAGLDWQAKRVVTPDTEVAAEMVRCVPDLLLLVTLGLAGVGLGDVSEDELTCMREWAAGIDFGEQLFVVGGYADLAALELGEGFFACAPGLPVPGFGAGAAPAPGGADATPVAVGTPVEATLSAVEFVQVFAFEAERGVDYQIDVSPGTLSDPAATLYDADWRELDFSDDFGGSLGARIYWEATYSGTHYIEVWGYGVGSYTVSVVARD